MREIGVRVWKDVYKYKWFILGFLIYYIFSHRMWGAYCPFLLTTGLPCPGCGMSRAVFFVFTFQFSRAWLMNPVAFLWAILIVLFVIYRYILGRSVKKLRMPLIIVLMLTIGYYFYRMIMIYPSYPPMVYRRNNLLEKIFPFYRDLVKKVFDFY